MRYSDHRTSSLNYSRSNLLAQRINVHEYFEDIHKQSPPEFKQFYVKRTPNVAPSIEDELLSYLSSMTISNLADTSHATVPAPDPTELRTRISGESRSRRTQTVTIVAPKGSGKTTFLHYFFLEDLRRLKELYPKVTFVTPIFDFREQVTAGMIRLETSVKAQIREHVDKQLIETLWPGATTDKLKYYEHVYKLDLELFPDILLAFGQSNDAHKFGSPEYLRQVECLNSYKTQNPFDYLSKRVGYYRKQFPDIWIIITVDNVDHHLPENPNGIIAIFQQLKEKIDTDLIFALRDTSFLQLNTISRHDAWGGLRVLTLEPVDMSLIGSPRVKITLDRGRKLLSSEEQDFLAEIASQALVNEPSYNKPVKFNFEKIWNWTQHLTNYNYRYALDLLSRSLRSFHLFDDNFERERHTPARRFDHSVGGIHIKKMKTALINGLELFYSAEKSGTPVINLFDAGDLNLKGNHILRLKILQYLAKQDSFLIQEGTDRLTGVCGNVYASAIRKSVFEMIRKGIIIIINESGISMDFGDDYGGIDKFEDVSEMTGRIGACGRFHLDILLDDDIYLDEMKYGTDFDQALYHAVFERIPERTSTARKNSTRRFIKEIRNIEERFSSWSRSLGVTPDRLGHSLSEYESQKAREEFFQRAAG